MPTKPITTAITDPRYPNPIPSPPIVPIAEGSATSAKAALYSNSANVRHTSATTNKARPAVKPTSNSPMRIVNSELIPVNQANPTYRFQLTSNRRPMKGLPTITMLMDMARAYPKCASFPPWDVVIHRGKKRPSMPVWKIVLHPS